MLDLRKRRALAMVIGVGLAATGCPATPARILEQGVIVEFAPIQGSGPNSASGCSVVIDQASGVRTTLEVSRTACAQLVVGRCLVHGEGYVVVGEPQPGPGTPAQRCTVH